jgi:proton-dependent oligopeptide transporter, POT family
MKQQPKALYLLACIVMWECFSYYGMRALLVLYMVAKLGFGDLYAFGVYAVFSGLFELSGVAGSLVAERYIGLRRSIVLGSWLLASGYILLVFELVDFPFYASLGLLVVGYGLFYTNISTLLGLYYKPEDPKREEGFTLFYSAINLGALLAIILCGVVADCYGWSYGFGLAALGMIAGNITWHLFQPLLEDKGLPPQDVNRFELNLIYLLIIPVILFLALCIKCEALLLPLLPWLGLTCIAGVSYRLIKIDTSAWKSLVLLMTYLLSIIVFYGAQEQMGSTLVLFTERFIDRSIGGLSVPATTIMSLNPLAIIVLGPFLNWLFKKIKSPAMNETVFLHRRLACAFLIAGGAFLILWIICLFHRDGEAISLLYLVPLILSISMAEVMVGPAVFAACSEISCKYQLGFIMGLIPIGFSLASTFGGLLSKMMAIEGEGPQQIAIYGLGFETIAIILLASGLLLGILTQLMNKNKRIVAI